MDLVRPAVHESKAWPGQRAGLWSEPECAWRMCVRFRRNAGRRGANRLECPDMGGLDVIVVRALDGLAAHAEPWNRLAFVSPQQAPMLSYAWISAYFEHRLQPGESWFCLLAYDGSDLAGVLPVVVSPRPGLRLAGRTRTVLRTPYDPHTISIAPLVAAGRELEVIPRLLDMAGETERGWFCMEMERVPESSPVVALLDAGGDASGRGPVIKELRSTGAYLPIRGAFATYRDGLSRNFRNNLNKARNKLRKLGGVEMRFLTGAEATEAQLAEFAQVEAASWKGEAGTAIAASPELLAFYTTLTRRLSQAGWLEWHFLRAEGTSIAANLAVRLQRSLLLWKLGYDHAYARCSPGSLLFEALAERAFADGAIQEVNLMTDWAWYDNWQMEKRRCFNLHLYARRPAPLLLGYAPRRAKAYLRDSPTVQQARHYMRQTPAVQQARAYLASAPSVRRSLGLARGMARRTLQALGQRRTRS